jgi:ketosteroid isomerase-like protein
MSSEMVDVVCRACAAWSAGDLAPLRELYTVDVVADGGRMWFEHEDVVRGREAVIAGFAALIGAFERNELLPEATVRSGETLVVPLLWRGLPPGGTAFVEQRIVGNFTFRDGQISAMVWFPTIEEALAAAGLPRTAASDLVAVERAPGGGPSS